jgi:hypothetical protein
VDTAVLQLGENRRPVLGALAAVAGPQPQDLPGALDRDGQGHADRAVGDLAVADLHMDSVDEDHAVDHPGSSGRCRHSAMPSMTLSVMVEIVCRDTWAPWTSARWAWTSPAVRPLAAREMTISSTPVSR